MLADACLLLKLKLLVFYRITVVVLRRIWDVRAVLQSLNRFLLLRLLRLLLHILPIRFSSLHDGLDLFLGLH